MEQRATRARGISARTGVVLASLLLATACASSPEHPDDNALDRFNRGSAKFNHWMTQNAIKPVAKGYNFVVPKPLQEGIANLLVNIERPRDIVNSVLQWKWERAGRHLAHMVINATFGLGGLFYVSDGVLYDDSPETFNETLGVWGVPPGPFVALPLVVPPFADTSPRHLLGAAADAVMSPLFWAIPGTTGTIVSVSTNVTGGLNTVATAMPGPFASESEWAAFEEVFGEFVPYEEQKALFFENQALDVAD